MNQITHLIPMEDFVLMTLKAKMTVSQKAKALWNYATLLKQTPELWMFVPCDEDGKVMIAGKGMIPIDSPSYMGIYTAYHTAKQRCLFEWFEVDEFSGLIKLEMGDLHLCCNKDTPNKIVIIGTQNMPAPILRNISDLTKYNLKLSQTAINKIYQ